MRAVEQHLIKQKSFVFSVPFNVGDANDTLVTASHAIFMTQEARSAPAAVVGFQFQQSALYNFFKNVTNLTKKVSKSISNKSANEFLIKNFLQCTESSDLCDADINCFADDGRNDANANAGCYILDDNGYVIVSTKREETGAFFGEVREWLMKRFVEENIYKRVTINNYQAVCETGEKTDGNSGSILHGVRTYRLLTTKCF